MGTVKSDVSAAVQVEHHPVIMGEFVGYAGSEGGGSGEHEDTIIDVVNPCARAAVDACDSVSAIGQKIVEVNVARNSVSGELEIEDIARGAVHREGRGRRWQSSCGCGCAGRVKSGIEPQVLVIECA